MPKESDRRGGRPVRTVRGEPLVQRYRVPLLGAIGVIVVVAIIVIAALQAGGGSSGPAAVATPASPTLVQAVTGLQQSEFDTVGTGGASNPLHPINGQSVTADGKPEILYVGAEYCPYCAAERWAMVVALSRFGTFTGLKTTRSAPNDVYANTPTFSFYGSSYTSNVLAFTGVETESNVATAGGYEKLQTLTSEQQALAGRYNPGGSIPFMYLDGKYTLSGASYSPGLFSGMDWTQVAQKLADPTSSQAKAVLGTANMLTAAFCQVTNGQPTKVCQAAGTKTAARAMGIGG